MRYRKLIYGLLVTLLVLLTLNVPHSVSAQDNPAQKYKDIARNVVQEAYGRGNVSVMNANYAPEYVRHPGETNLNNVKASILALRAAMPDLKANITLLIADTNWVALRLSLSGMLKNELVFPNSAPIPPNSKPIALETNIVFRFNDKDRIAEEWNGFDNVTFLSQIGAFPVPKDALRSPLDKGEVKPTGAEAQNKDTIRLYLEGLGKGDWSVINQRFRADLSAHNSFGKLNRLELITDLLSLRRALPNLTITVNQLIAEGNWLAALYTVRGTFTANYVGPDDSVVKPTGKSIDLLIVTLFRFDENNMVAESWELYDSWNFALQLDLPIKQTK